MPRTRSQKEIARVARREDDRQLKKTEGAWYVFDTGSGVTALDFTNGKRMVLGLPVPRFEAASGGKTFQPNRDSTTVYAMNSVLAIQYVSAGGTDTGIIKGVIYSTKVQEPAQGDPGSPASLDDKLPLFTADANLQVQPQSNEWPWRWAQFFALSTQNNAQARRSLFMPFRFRRGHQIRLRHDEVFLIMVEVPGWGGPTGTHNLQCDWYGRYRFVQTSQ